MLEDQGGWPVRATAEAFADYAEVVAARLGDRISNWMTMNEPYVIANLGYLTGEHAPGRCSLPDSLAAAHHVLVGHGLAMERVRAAVPGANVGIVLNFTPVTPIGSSPAALDRQRIVDDVEQPLVHRPDRRARAIRSTPSSGWDGSRRRSSTATWS